MQTWSSGHETTPIMPSLGALQDVHLLTLGGLRQDDLNHLLLMILGGIESLVAEGSLEDAEVLLDASSAQGEADVPHQHRDEGLARVVVQLTVSGTAALHRMAPRCRIVALCGGLVLLGNGPELAKLMLECELVHTEKRRQFCQVPVSLGISTVGHRTRMRVASQTRMRVGVLAHPFEMEDPKVAAKLEGRKLGGCDGNGQPGILLHPRNATVDHRALRPR